MKVAITGVSGLVGTALRSSLTKDGHDVIAISRRASLPPLETITWDVDNGRVDASGLEGVDALVHLAGEPVAQRWNDARKIVIRKSRIDSTRLLIEALRSLKNPPKLLVSASAVGFYGDGGDTELDVETITDVYLVDANGSSRIDPLEVFSLNLHVVPEPSLALALPIGVAFLSGLGRRRGAQGRGV